MAENKKLVALMAFILISGLVFVIRGCGRYGEVGSDAYQHAKALYSICNRRDAERLKQFSVGLTEARDSQKITEKEYAWMDDILTEARKGNWADATAKSRQLLEDQVDGNP